MRLRSIRQTGLILLFAVFMVCQSAAAWAFFGGKATPQNLSELCDQMAKELKADYPGRKLYITPDDIKNDRGDTSCQFTVLLANELERALSKSGFAFGTIGSADFAIEVTYSKLADKVRIFAKLKDQKDSYRNLKGEYELPLDTLPADCFLESLDSKLSRLAMRAARGWQKSRELTLFVSPLVESRKKYSSPFAEYVTRKLKTSLTTQGNLKVVEEQPVVQKLSGARSIKKDSATVETADAAIVGADAVLEGGYLRGNQEVNLALTLKNLKGVVLSSAEEAIPLSLIQYSLDNDAAEAIAQFTDTEHESSKGMVKVGTTKGGNYQVYLLGEVVKFTIQVAKPLYIYVYNINPLGEAVLLFPKKGEAETARMPGLIHMIPEDTDSWEIKVEPPFGTDAVKVFASEKRLPLPVIDDRAPSRSFIDGTRSLKRVEVQSLLAKSKSINGRDLVDYYKGVAGQLKTSLYESTVYVETREK